MTSLSKFKKNYSEFRLYRRRDRAPEDLAQEMNERKHTSYEEQVSSPWKRWQRYQFSRQLGNSNNAAVLRAYRQFLPYYQTDAIEKDSSPEKLINLCTPNRDYLLTPRRRRSPLSRTQL